MSYLEVLKAFKDVSLSNVHEQSKFDIQLWVMTGSMLFAILLNFLCFNQNLAVMIFIALLYSATVAYFMRQAKKYFIENVAVMEDQRTFLKQNMHYWRAPRALLFFEKVFPMEPTETERLTSVIDKEVTLKKFDVFKQPFVSGILIVIGFILNNLFSKMEIPSLLLGLAISFIVLYFAWSASIVLRTEASKMDDLKLFLLWYKEFGNDWMKEKEKK